MGVCQFWDTKRRGAGALRAHRWVERFLVGGLAAALSAGSLTAQSNDAPVRVNRGRLLGVFDEQTGQPLEGVEVRNLFNGLSVLTTVTGTVSLFFVDTSGAMLTVRKLGYEPLTIAVGNAPSDTVPITLTLKRVAQVLPAVVTKAKADSAAHYISPSLRAFEERRHQGFGHFISESDLRKYDSEQLDGVLAQHVPGVYFVRSRLVAHRVGGNSFVDRSLCYVTVYVDGVVTYSKRMSGVAPPDFRQMNVSDYAGVEFYAGGATMPVQYNATDSGCGVLLLWTRER